MKKYLYGFKLYFLNSFQYRFNTVINLLFGNMSLMVTMFFWVLIFNGDFRKTLNGFTLSGIITYFIVSNITSRFTLQGSGFYYTSMVKSGSLGSVLLKPYRLVWSVYFQQLSTSITGLIPQVLFVLIALPFVAGFLIWNVTIMNILIMVLFVLIASVTSHLLWSIFGFLAFWMEEATAVMWSLAVLLNMAMGMYVPLDFFPKGWLSVLEKLPFAAWGYLPSKIYLGSLPMEKQLQLLLIHFSWIMILLMIHQLVWKAGIKRFSSVGG